MEPQALLEEVTQEFVHAWEAGEAPTLEAYLRRYPQLAPELTEFAAEFFELGAGAAPGMEAAAAEDDPAVRRVLAVVRGEGATLREARKAAGWTAGQLARKLNLPEMALLWLERGTLRDWPARLEGRLAELFGRSREQVAQMLRAASPGLRAAPAHYRAEGPPQPASSRGRSFSEALEECARLEQLTESQRGEWLVGPEG